MKFLFDHDVPDEMEFSLKTLGHEVVKLREVSNPEIVDEDVLRLANQRDCVLITCNRDDFLRAAQRVPHVGIIILIRRRSRAHERAALVGLLDKAGDTGIRNNINFA